MCTGIQSLPRQRRRPDSIPAHHIFTNDGVEEILSLQPKSAKAKPYQVKQVRTVILKYRLGGKEDDSI